MPTIQELHDLVNLKETQAGTTDRITGAEVRAVDNAIIDELALRGITVVPTTADLATYPTTESKKVLVPDNGTFVLFQTADAPDGVMMVASVTPGYLWKREIHNVVREEAKESDHIVAHSMDDDKLRQSVTLKTLTDWVIQNFEPRTPTIEDLAFIKVMGGFLHGVEQGRHRRIALDESHNRFYVVGAFDSYKGKTLKCIARFYLDGSADEEFNTNAASIFDVYLANRAYSGALFCVLQSDGKPIVAGYDSVMLPYLKTPPYYIMFGRVNQDGTIDQEYVDAIGQGLGQLTYYPRGCAIQPDDKIIFTGDFWEYNGQPAGHIVRILPDGSMDMAFQSVVGGLDWSVYTILIQPDGKIVMAGDHSMLNGLPIPRVFRLNADGTRDEPFITNVGTAVNGTAYWGTLQPDGKIILTGSFTQFNGVNVGRVLRLNADGTLDTAFNTAIGTGANAYIPAVALQADGKILVGGDFTSFNGVTIARLARLNSDGTLDTAFNTALGTGFNLTVASIVVQSDKRIIVAGSFDQFNGQPRPSGIVRLLPDLPSDEIIPPWSR